LDIHFFLQVCEKFINDSINQLANKLCEYALRSYYLTLASEKESNPEANTDIQLKVYKKKFFFFFGIYFLLIKIILNVSYIYLLKF